uniref:39S ribosomal protein L33, mitochondrial n=1 Tax=Capitella teleta TaxID=283909 RepID=X1Z087_CAPTE
MEAFHSLLNQFAPKMTAFHFQAMNGRVLLAVMHFNENSNRQSKISRDGKEQYSIHYPKYRKGDPIVRRIKTAPTHSKLPFVL